MLYTDEKLEDEQQQQHGVDEDKRSQLVDRIKKKLICNKRLKPDPSPRYPELDDMQIKELEEVLFNLAQDEGESKNIGIATFILRSVGATVEPMLDLPGLQQDMCEDKDLVENVASELGKWTDIPNVVMICMRIANHVYQGLETSYRRQREGGSRTIPQINKETKNDVV
jgi:hypothetical protein